MNDKNVSKEDVKKLIQAYDIKTVGDIQNAMKDLFGKAMQDMLEAELDSSLGYNNHDYQNKETENSRNGYSPKTVTTKHGPVRLNIPREDDVENVARP